MTEQHMELVELIEGFERRGVVEYGESLEEIAQFLESKCGERYAPQYFRDLSKALMMAHDLIHKYERNAEEYVSFLSKLKANAD